MLVEVGTESGLPWTTDVKRLYKSKRQHLFPQRVVWTHVSVKMFRIPSFRPMTRFSSGVGWSKLIVGAMEKYKYRATVPVVYTPCGAVKVKFKRVLCNMSAVPSTKS